MTKLQTSKRKPKEHVAKACETCCLKLPLPLTCVSDWASSRSGGERARESRNNPRSGCHADSLGRKPGDPLRGPTCSFCMSDIARALLRDVGSLSRGAEKR